MLMLMFFNIMREAPHWVANTVTVLHLLKMLLIATYDRLRTLR